MAKWYINDVGIENAVVTSRQVSTPWAQSSGYSYGYEATIKTIRQQAQPIVLNISLRGTDRFASASSIRAELDGSPTVYVYSSENNVYEDRKYCWLMPTGFNVIDQGVSHPLKCALSGMVDKRTLHNCDFITNWAGNSPAANSSTKFGQYSIKDTWSTDATHDTIHTPVSAMDISNCEHVCLWVKLSQAASWFGTLQLLLKTNSDYYAWNIDTVTANTWTYKTYELVKPSSSSGTPSLSNITAFGLRTNPPSATSYDIYLAWLWVE